MLTKLWQQIFYTVAIKFLNASVEETDQRRTFHLNSRYDAVIIRKCIRRQSNPVTGAKTVNQIAIADLCDDLLDTSTLARLIETQEFVLIGGGEVLTNTI